MAASSRRRRAESKILPQIAHFVADRGVGKFEIAQHRFSLLGLSLQVFCVREAEARVREQSVTKAQSVGEEIAVAGVEGEVVLVAEGDAAAQVRMWRGSGGGDAAVGIDGCGDAGVGGAKDPAVVFDGAHADHVEVLPGGAGVAVPAVVGDVDEDVARLAVGELADLVAEDGLVADKDAVFFVADR